MAKLLGYSGLSSGASWGAGVIEYEKLTASASGSMTQFRHTPYASGNFKFAVYADNAGVPGVLLNETGSLAGVGGVENIFAFPATDIVSGTSYWLAVNSETALTAGATGGFGSSRFQVRAFSLGFQSSPATGADSRVINVAGYSGDGAPMYAYAQQ